MGRNITSSCNDETHYILLTWDIFDKYLLEHADRERLYLV